MAEAITTAISLLNAGWNFIEANPILFGACTLSLVSGTVYTVKSFFR